MEEWQLETSIHDKGDSLTVSNSHMIMITQSVSFHFWIVVMEIFLQFCRYIHHKLWGKSINLMLKLFASSSTSFIWGLVGCRHWLCTWKMMQHQKYIDTHRRNSHGKSPSKRVGHWCIQLWWLVQWLCFQLVWFCICADQTLKNFTHEPIGGICPLFWLRIFLQHSRRPLGTVICLSMPISG